MPPRTARRNSRERSSHVAGKGAVDGSELSRKLDFINISIDEIKGAILSEMPDYRLNDVLLYHLLAKDPDPGFKSFQNRSLAYWVGAFNRWQALGDWKPDKQVQSRHLEVLNAHDIQVVLNVDRMSLTNLIKLFDPEGDRRLRAEAGNWTSHALGKVQVNMFELMMAGVMLSRKICTKHKLRFVFGLVDLDDDKELDERQFTNFIYSFIKGMASAFGLGDNKDVLPTQKQMSIKAQRLYSRIGYISAQRLLRIHAVGDDGDKARLLTAVKKRCQEHAAQQQRPGSRDARERNDGSAKVARSRQVLKFRTLEDWCLRVFKDPLALPYALLIERFRAERYGDMADQYDPNLSNFYLSHLDPVDVGEENAEVHSSELLSRQEVVVAKQIYDEAAIHNFYVSTFALESKLNLHFDGSFGEKIRRAVMACDEEFRSAGYCGECRAHIPCDVIFCDQCGKRRPKADFGHFLKRMCPAALPKHLHMFETWRHECDEMLKLTRLLKTVQEYQRVFLENEAKPFLPVDEVHLLEQSFESISLGRGFVTQDDFNTQWGWDWGTIKKTMERFDVDASGKISKLEFMRMMCPLEYRVPEMSGYERKLFGQFIEAQVERQRSELDARMRPWLASSWREFLEGEISDEMKKKRLCLGEEGDEPDTWRSMFARAEVADDKQYASMAMPVSALPEVEDEEWNRWNAVFDDIDQDKDGVISVFDLDSCGWLSHRMCKYVMTVIDPETPQSCKKQGFLAALLQASRKKRVGFFM